MATLDRIDTSSNQAVSRSRHGFLRLLADDTGKLFDQLRIDAILRF